MSDDLLVWLLVYLLGVGLSQVVVCPFVYEDSRRLMHILVCGEPM